MDSITIKNTGPVTGSFRVPGSKSLSARAILTAALAEGMSELPGLLVCEDTTYLAQALTNCGLIVSFGEDGNNCVVDGLGGDFPCRAGDLFIGNSGTAMRFLTAILTVAEGDYILDGTERMRKRPIKKLIDALKALGAGVESVKGFPPVTVGPAHLKGGRILIPGNESSQFISALLLAGPYSSEGVEVEVTGEVVSRPYLDITCSVMKDFGCRVHASEDPLVYKVEPGKYQPMRWEVEPDASSGSYFAAAAAVTGGEVTLEGLGQDSIQGDMVFLDVLESMGCEVEKKGKKSTVRGGPLKGVSINARDFPDMVPTIAAVAVFADGETEIRGVPHLRIKESDRIKSVATEFAKFGANVSELDDGLLIKGGTKLRGAEINTWNDHRIAMSAAVIGLAVPGQTVIKDHGVAAKSFPGFFDIWPGVE